MIDSVPLRKRLSQFVDLRIPGFERQVPPGQVYQLTFRDRSVGPWFDEFIELTCSAIGRRFLPVFRISDGEFTFSVGTRLPHPPPGKNPVLHYAREVASYLRWRRFDTFLSGAPENDLERYRGREWRRLRGIYSEQLRQIAREGILAVTLVKTPERFGERFHEPMLQWFDREHIPVHERNYFPFYFVYGLLNGPARSRVYRGRRVLVITSLTPTKQQAIEAGLLNCGVSSVQFVPVSSTHAMSDALDLSRVQRPVDVILVGAGVGAANALLQVREFETLALDAGHCIDLLATPSLAGQRVFTQPDEPFDASPAS